MKKYFIKILCLTFLLMFLLTGGCFTNSCSCFGCKGNSVGETSSGCGAKKLYNYGDFVITKDKEMYDFSSYGSQKKYIIFPIEIKGVKTVMFYQRVGIMWLSREDQAVFSYYENIKKFYQVDAFDLANSKAISSSYSSSYKQSYTGLSNYYNKTEQSILENGDKSFILQKGKHKYFSNNVSRYQYKFYGYKNDYIRTYLKEQELVFAYLPKTDYNKGKTTLTENVLLANVQFMYNYEDSANLGYYWIDDLEMGETLSYIPPNPTRAGYTFAGWYKDSECTIPYNFASPYEKKDLIFKEGLVNGKESYMFVYPQDYVTYIYAKWIPNTL